MTMVTLFVMEMFSITPLMLTTVPGGSGVAVGGGIGVGVAVGAVAGLGTTVLVAANASTVMLWAKSAPSAVISPLRCAMAPSTGVPVIAVCASRAIGVPATIQRSWASCSMLPSRVNGAAGTCVAVPDSAAVGTDDGTVVPDCAPSATRPQALNSREPIIKLATTAQTARWQ